MASTSGRIETVLIAGNSKFYLQWQQSSQSTSGNYTRIKWQAGLWITNGGAWYSNAVKINAIDINGSRVSNGGTWSNISGNGDHQLLSGTVDIPHNSDGNKYFGAYISGWLYANGNYDASGGWNLTQIPRYAKITSFSIASKTLTGFTLKYTADSSIDLVQHRINGGAWINGTTVTGLNPNTAYSLQIRVRRTDSQLWTESGTISGTTHDIARFSNLANSNFSDAVPVAITNPSGARVDLDIKIGNVVVASRTSIALSNTITFSQAELDTIYSLMTNNMPVTLTYVISTYNGSTIGWTVSEGKILTMKGTAKTVWENIAGIFKRGQVWINIEGTWKKGLLWKNINGIWKRGK
jgi:hypothetical protein